MVSLKPVFVGEPQQVGMTTPTMHQAEKRGNKQVGKGMREYAFFDYFQS